MAAELGQQPVQPARRLGPRRDELIAPIAQQPRGSQHRWHINHRLTASHQDTVATLVRKQGLWRSG